MKRWIAFWLIVTILFSGCTGQGTVPTTVPEQTQSTLPEATEPDATQGDAVSDTEAFILGADVSSLIAQEKSGVVYRDMDGNPQDLLKTLSEAGMNYIRVRVWNDPFDAQGNGYGGGNCDLNNAIEIGRRAAEYGMKLLVDFHYSDFWADPGKQQAPKAWAGMSLEEKAQALREYTANSLLALKKAGVDVGMVQIGNETTGGFCGEWTPDGQYKLMADAAKAVRDSDSTILIAVHYTNPERKNYGTYAKYLQDYGVDYDVFSTSYYPYWHGTLENLTAQLTLVVQSYGKKVMVAETSWAYTAEDTDDHRNSVGQSEAGNAEYPFSVQGQTDAITDVIHAVEGIGEAGIGVFYWEPAWIAVPGNSWKERSEIWEQYGSGWASSFAGEYDPVDAGVYFGGSACDNQAMFDENGYPLASLLAFFEASSQ